MEERCVWFYVWTRNCFADDWFHVASFRTFAACRRYADRVHDKYASIVPVFKFEKVVFLNGSIVDREFIA